VEQRGAGEILLQSVDMDGRRRGFDIELASEIVDLVNIPVVVSSGAGSLEDIKTLIEVVNPSGVAIASLLHYEQTTILEIKEYLNNMMVSQ
jgi:cyclase